MSTTEKRSHAHRLNLDGVRHYLQHQPDGKGIADAISALLDLHQFQYLTAYVNTTKHRSLVQAKYTAHLDPSDNPRQGFRIKTFQYRNARGNVHYDQIWGDEFLFAEAQHVRNGVLTIGNTLNRFYADKQGST